MGASAEAVVTLIEPPPRGGFCFSIVVASRFPLPVRAAHPRVADHAPFLESLADDMLRGELALEVRAGEAGLCVFARRNRGQAELGSVNTI